MSRSPDLTVGRATHNCRPQTEFLYFLLVHVTPHFPPLSTGAGPCPPYTTIIASLSHRQLEVTSYLCGGHQPQPALPESHLAEQGRGRCLVVLWTEVELIPGLEVLLPGPVIVVEVVVLNQDGLCWLIILIYILGHLVSGYCL